MNWTPLIDLNDKIRYNAIKDKIDLIYITIKRFESKESKGLLAGDCGCLLFLYYYYRLTHKKEALLILQSRVEKISQNIVRIRNGSFCNGYAGICWLLRFFANEGIIDSSDMDDLLQEVDICINQLIVYELQKKDFDFLHGSLGMAYYFSTQNNNNGNEAITTFLNVLYENKINNTDGSIKWLMPAYINVNECKMVYNLSLSHGMASIIALLSKLTKKVAFESLSKEILKKSMLYFKNHIHPDIYRSCFSPWISPDSNEYIESRLCWCYGDPGIAKVLHNAGIVLNTPEYTHLALNVFAKNANRKNTKIENVSEACFCHGTSSLCHIYNRMYQETNIKSFKNTAIYWLDETLMMGNNKSNYAGYIFNDMGNINMNYSLLSGLTGVGLTLIATISPEEAKWDECVLLS